MAASVGDVDFESARQVASAITPVPGGVGPLTNALLLTHLIRAAERQAPADRPARDRLTRGDPMTFPSDLEIARSVTPAADRRHRGRARHPRRRARAVRADEGKGEARRDHPARGRATARQVRRRHRDHPDAARRGQVDDDGRPRPGAQPDRPEGVGEHPPAIARPGVRDQGWGCRWRLQPGHPDGGLQPPSDRRRPRHRRRAQPGRRFPRQQPPPQEPAGHRSARDPLAARPGHQRSRPPARGDRSRRARGRRPARDRVRDHGRLGGDGGPRARHRPVRPAGSTRSDGPRDPRRRDAADRGGHRRRRRDDGAAA